MSGCGFSRRKGKEKLPKTENIRTEGSWSFSSFAYLPERVWRHCFEKEEIDLFSHQVLVPQLHPTCLSPGCYHRISQTGWRINNRNVFLIVLRAGSVRCLLRACFLIRGRLSLCPHVAEGARDVSGVLFIKARISFMRSPSHHLITSQRAPPNTSHWGLGFQPINFGGTQTFNTLYQPSASVVKRVPEQDEVNSRNNIFSFYYSYRYIDI